MVFLYHLVIIATVKQVSVYQFITVQLTNISTALVLFNIIEVITVTFVALLMPRGGNS